MNLTNPTLSDSENHQLRTIFEDLSSNINYNQILYHAFFTYLSDLNREKELLLSESFIIATSQMFVHFYDFNDISMENVMYLFSQFVNYYLLVPMADRLVDNDLFSIVANLNHFITPVSFPKVPLIDLQLKPDADLSILGSIKRFRPL